MRLTVSPEPPIEEIMPWAISWSSAWASSISVSDKHPLERLDLGLGVANRDVPGLDELLEGVLGGLELAAVLLELLLDGAELEGVLAGHLRGCRP